MHQRAQAVFAHVLEQVADDDLASVTPCDEWTVADLIDHVVEGNHWAAIQLSATEQPLPDGDCVAKYRTAADQAHAAFSSPGALDGTVELPIEEIPRTVFIAIRSGDLYTHAWDLATTLGADTDLDRELGEAVWMATAPALSPALRGEGRPFGPEQPCDADRPIADRYAALLGRTVDA